MRTILLVLLIGVTPLGCDVASGADSGPETDGPLEVDSGVDGGISDSGLDGGPGGADASLGDAGRPRRRPACALDPGAWCPPIGIPAPSFGIEEMAPAMPSAWDSEISGFYYIDNEVGTDTDREYGTPASPRSTIPRSLPAGAVVFIVGEYRAPHGSPRGIRAAGTAEAPIFIRGISAEQPAEIRSRIEIDGSYYVLEYLNARWDNASYGKLVMSGDHGVLRHSETRGDLGTGIGSVSPSGSTQMVIWDNFIHDAGDVNADFDQDVHCIPVGPNTDHLWIVDNELARCSGDGVQLNAGNAARQSTLHHIYIGRNVSHGHKQSGLWTKQAVDVIMSENVVYDLVPSDSSSGAGLGGQYAPDYVWFIYNEVYDTYSGIRIEANSDLGTGTEVFVIGNVIHDLVPNGDPGNPHSSGAVVFRGGVNRFVVDNTLWGYPAGVMSPSGGRLEIVNNIFGGRLAPEGRDIFVELAETAAASAMSHNLVPADARIQWGDSAVNNLADFVSTTGQGAGASSDAPLFEGTPPDPYALTAESPGVDAGTAHSVYDLFLERYGIDIDVGVHEVARSGANDIGAYERE